MRSWMESPLWPLIVLTLIFLIRFVPTVLAERAEAQKQAKDAEPPESVPFEIRSVATPESGTLLLDAHHGTTARRAHFQIELGPVREGHSSFKVGFGSGAFIAQADSNAGEFLRLLKVMLEAKHGVPTPPRVTRLPFDYVTLGSPESGWTHAKLFFHGDESEVYLNWNASQGRAEFSIKDVDYGDSVLRELAKVL